MRTFDVVYDSHSYGVMQYRCNEDVIKVKSEVCGCTHSSSTRYAFAWRAKRIEIESAQQTLFSFTTKHWQ